MSIFLVTGGAGFIGSNIVAQLVAQGEQVRVLDNFSSGRRANLAPFADRIEVIEGDIRSYHIVQEAVKGVDYVLHQAALPSVPRSVRDPITSTEVNVLGTLNVLEAAHDAGVKRMVFASSSSVYGRGESLPKHEGMCPQPMSPYAVSKLSGEQYCQVFWQIYGFETVCLRYFNVFGQRQDPTSQYSAVIPRFATAILEGRTLTVYGDGSQSRDFTHVSNVVAANLLACTAADAPGGVFNVACGERYSLLDLIDSLGQILERKPQVQFAPARPGDVPHSMAAIDAARQTLGYEPKLGFHEALRQTVAFYQADAVVPQAGR